MICVSLIFFTKVSLINIIAMQSYDALLVALLAVLVVLILWQCYKDRKYKCREYRRRRDFDFYPGRYDAFTSGDFDEEEHEEHDRKGRKERKESFSPGTDEYHRVGRNVSAGDYEKQLWCHDVQPVDYASQLTDLITDDRIRSNHEKWVNEMKPWSGSPMSVDNMDEAMEATTDFIGLRRPQAVTQCDPFFITERHTDTFAGNAKFNFKG